ncbi:MAG: hypothetical protein ACYC0C_06780 [Devosia sp.]
MRALFFAVSIFLALGATPAQAAFTFGAEESLHALVDVAVVGENGEALALGYKTSTQNFLLPYSISDDGYVLIVKGEKGKYYDIGDEQLANWQASGLMPDPLPPYEIAFVDRILGYALWPTLAVIALVYLIPLLRKRKAAVATPTPPVDKTTT